MKGQAANDQGQAAVATGDGIEETGMLLRDGGGFVLQRDLGGRWPLDLSRVPVDLVGKHVRIVGVETAAGRIDVDGVRPA
jgi:hypothetical protein